MPDPSIVLVSEQHSELLRESFFRDSREYDLRTARSGPEALATTGPGIFAAGHVRAGSMKRVASASGEGASVIPLVHTYLAPVKEPVG